jgi:hypothetical protein
LIISETTGLEEKLMGIKCDSYFSAIFGPNIFCYDEYEVTVKMHIDTCIVFM